MHVTLLNPDVVETTLQDIGEFASICKVKMDSDYYLKNHTPEEVKKLRAIGMACLKSGHVSPCRAIYWKFHIDDISRVCSHQIVRHHIGIAVNQQSGVFQGIHCKIDDFVVPSDVRAILDANPKLKEKYKDYLTTGLELYDILKENGASNSNARYHIAQSSPTSLVIGFTPEALIHVCHERMCSHAQWEIRSVIRECARLVIEKEPMFKDLLVPKCVYLHGCNEKPSCGFYKQEATNV